MKEVEMLLNSEGMLTDGGVQAISIVDEPATESDFITLSKEFVQLATASEEKRLLMGAVLIPEKRILRVNKEGEKYNIWFSKDTVRKAMEAYMTALRLDKATLQHEEPLSGLSVVESWIVEDPARDKSAVHGLSLPEGTWAVSMKVYNDEVWEEYVKTGKVKGFSIEGFFNGREKVRAELSELLEDLEEYAAEEMLEMARAIVKNDNRRKDGKRVELESFSDYPDAVKNNAKRGIELNEANGNKCATAVGKVRAQQLAQGRAVSMETIKRMYSYLSRAEVYYEKGDSSDCGYISYLLWGGKAALRWAESKVKNG